MTDTNQTLREALQIAESALADIGDADREPGDDLAWCERRAAQDLPTIRQALALPTAAPVGERELPPLPEPAGSVEIDCGKYPHGPGRLIDCVDGYTADQMRAYARAALSAGDAVDAQRYRWLREQHWSNSDICCVNKPKQNVRLGGMCPSGDLLDAAIDAAMRKGQL